MNRAVCKIFAVLALMLGLAILSPVLSFLVLIPLLPNKKTFVDKTTWNSIKNQSYKRIRFGSRTFLNCCKKFSFFTQNPFYPNELSHEESGKWVSIFGIGVVKKNSLKLSWWPPCRISFWMSLSLGIICAILHYYLAQRLLSVNSKTITFDTYNFEIIFSKIPFTYWYKPYLSLLFGFCFFSIIAEILRITRYVYFYYINNNKTGKSQYFAAAVNWQSIGNFFAFDRKKKGRQLLNYLIIAIILVASVVIAIEGDSIIRAVQFAGQRHIPSPVVSSLFAVCFAAIFLLWRLSSLAKNRLIHKHECREIFSCQYRTHSAPLGWDVVGCDVVGK